MVITIPFKSNSIGLSALLVNLQPQLNEKDLIYIVDNSEDRKGLEIARLYTNGRTICLVETGNYTIYQAWNLGIDLMLENKQEGILILNDDVLLSYTCIANFKKAHNLTDDLCLVTKTPSRAYATERLNPNFKWFNKSITKEDIKETNWMCGFAFYLKKEAIDVVGKFDERYKIWFADTIKEEQLKGKIGLIDCEYLEHFASKSFKYKDEKTQKIISEDRELYFSQTKGTK